MPPVTAKASEEFADPDLSPGAVRRLWRRVLYLTPELLREWVREDLKSLGVWAPVAIGAGAGAYFSLKSEPAWMVAAGLVLFTLISLVTIRRHSRAGGAIAAALLLMAIGFAAADWRTQQVSAPVLTRDLGIQSITGELLSIEDRTRGQRMVIALHRIEGITKRGLPARARISWRGGDIEALPGDIITLRAGLGPPPPPAAPGSFDFARQLYFQKIGTVGFAVSLPQTTSITALSEQQTIRTRIEKLRSGLLARITNAAPGPGGAIVAAIVTGKRDAITPISEVALRDAGLAHLLAISGLHMGLATGLIFFAVRFTLAAIEPLALHFPIKKWAASAALVSGFFYLIVSGGSWSARRAFITTAIIFFAILVDRRALSLRNVAIAASIILLTTPEALFHPGFQMSFAAVTALIAGYEWLKNRADPDRSFSMLSRFRRYAVGLAATDIIAAGATAPFALYHFNRVALYSLPANVLAMPLMGFWVIPAALLALLLAPLGLDAPAWRLSAAGMGAILAIASEVSGWRGAVSYTWQWPLAALLVMTIGGLWLCLARSPLRLVGVFAIPLTIGIVSLANPPQIFVAASGMNAGIIRSEDEGGMLVYSARRDRFSAMVWGEETGLGGREIKPQAMATAGLCDKFGCVADINDVLISFISSPAALAEDCRRADLVIAFFAVSNIDRRSCGTALIDRRSVWDRGAHAIWSRRDGEIQIQTVLDKSGRRPWTGD